MASIIQFAWLKIDAHAVALESKWTSELSVHADAQLVADLFRFGVTTIPNPITATVRLMGAYIGLKFLLASAVGVRDTADEDVYKRLSLWYDSEYQRLLQGLTYTQIREA